MNERRECAEREIFAASGDQTRRVTANGRPVLAVPEVVSSISALYVFDLRQNNLPQDALLLLG